MHFLAEIYCQMLFLAFSSSIHMTHIAVIAERVLLQKLSNIKNCPLVIKLLFFVRLSYCLACFVLLSSNTY